VRLSTHVLDAALGQPAAGIPVRLDRLDGAAWVPVASGVTGTDGRLARWRAADDPAASEPPAGEPAPGVHRLTFDTGGYFADRGIAAFYPEVVVTFQVRDADGHYHLPLLLSPFAYSTYRGS
jgi:5-hydroxyisourate hydrolase